MTSARMRRFEQRLQVRAAVDRELIADRIEERREKLQAHNRAAIPAAAEVIGAMVDAAAGRVKVTQLRCDRSKRLRQFHLDGTKPLPVEDLVSIAMESDAGRLVVAAGVRELARICGYALTPLETAPVGDLTDASLSLAERTLEAGHDIARDKVDNGRIDEPEKHLSRLHAIGEAVPRLVASIRDAVRPRVEAYQTARASR